MSWAIDSFSAKPSGFLASWRSKQILVDENGTVTAVPIAGFPEINRPCLSDYSKNTRRYANNEKITEFCNLDTFTNYRIYAQDCEPFAYAQADFNAPKCGYLEPLPTPAVPPNPFGTAPYGLYKFFEFLDTEGNTNRVNISRKFYTGSPTEVRAGGTSPVILSYKNDDDNKFNSVRACECKVTFMSDSNFSLQEFYTADEREFKMESIKAGRTKFVGFIIPDSCQEPFINPPYPVSLRATDGLGALQRIAYPMPVGSSIDIRQDFVAILAYALSQTNLGLEIHTICNLYERKMANGLDDDPLKQATVNPLRMSKGGTVFNCYQVLEEVAKLFGAFISQIDGAWHFIRVSELPNQLIRKRVYNNTAFFIRAENVINSKAAGNTGQDIKVLSDDDIRIGNAYKRAVVQLEFGDVPATLYNGDFEQWDGQNFRYWTRYGGLDVSRVQKSIPGVGGAPLLIPDYAIQFNRTANVGKWLEAAPIAVFQNDKITLSFGYNIPNKLSYQFKFIFKVGQYCWALEPLGRNEWATALTTATFYQPGNGVLSSSFNFVTIKLDLPPIPIDGNLIIQVLGAEEAREENRASYVPVQFDNFRISKSKNTDDEDQRDGNIYVSEQLGFFTEVPETTEIIFGEYQQPSTTVTVRPNRADNITSKTADTLHAIYTSDKSYAEGWKEYGQVADYAPIGLCLSRAMMKLYQKAYRFFEGNFKGDSMSYLDVFNIILDSDPDFSAIVFAPLSVDYDLKYNTATGTWAEIFSRPIKTIDISLPHTPGQEPPPFVQNPTTPTKATGDHVFDPTFTEVFA